jgi:hypothetical protein
MFDREHWVGVALLAVCGIVGGVLLWTIATRTALVYDGPGWLPPVLTVVYVGALVYAFVQRSKSGF